MRTLCFASNLTSAEWAAWVQAIGSIVAIFAAAALAVSQSRAQHLSATALLKYEQRHSRLDSARTLLVLAQNCSKAARHFSAEMHDRDSVHSIASGEKYFDFEELRNLERTTSGIPLYSLPDTLVTHAMVLGATVRQFRQTVEIAIRDHRRMDANAFGNLFHTLSEMNDSLVLTCNDIENEVLRAEQDA